MTEIVRFECEPPVLRHSARVQGWACAQVALACVGFAAFAASPLAEEASPVRVVNEGGPNRTGRTEEVVGKMNIVEHKSGDWSCELNDAERATLFEIAESSLRWCVTGTDKAGFSFDRFQLTPRLQEMRATFVTLKIRGRLRGCIGSLAPVAPLYRSVHDNAVNAALRDFRFTPVTAAELGQLEIHVSILSPIREIASLDQFKIGAHGIIMAKGRSRAVYLPEVAVEQRWTMEETLASLSEKAGLSPDAWREGATFSVFSSVVLERK